MTSEEEIDFKILEALVKANFNGLVDFKEMTALLNPIIGTGSWAILKNMYDRGLLDKEEPFDRYQLTEAGRNLYQSFRRKKVAEFADMVLKYSGILIGVLSLIATIVIAQWQSKQSTIQDKLLQDLQQVRSQNDSLKDSIGEMHSIQPIPQSKTDTVKGAQPK